MYSEMRAGVKDGRISSIAAACTTASIGSREEGVGHLPPNRREL